MITGQIKNQIDQIWDTFWTGGITNSITLLEQVRLLNDHHIAVRDKWASVSRFRKPDAWQYLSAVDVLTLKNDIAPLVSMPGEDETALKFDLLILYSQLGLINPEFDPIRIFGGKFPKVAEFVTHIHESISIA